MDEVVVVAVGVGVALMDVMLVVLADSAQNRIYKSSRNVT